ncbi:MAG: L,D-transpeptidase family protein [Nocardioidaceae bacterium]
MQCKRRLVDTSMVLLLAGPGAYHDDVSHLHQTGDRSSPAPQRVLAVVGAVLVTLLAVGGALGFVPGAQADASPPAQHRAAPGAEGGTGSSATSGPASAAPSAGTSSRTSPDPWLRIDARTEKDKRNPSADSHQRAASPTSHADDAETTDLPPSSGQGERVVYDISAQRVWLVDADARVLRTYLVSGARNEQLLDPGSYHVSSKSLHAISFNHKETMDFMVRFAQGEHSAIGFHDVPALPDGSLAQSRADLGTPTSAGCIRQWRPDARALWRFTDVGSLVVVTA